MCGRVFSVGRQSYLCCYRLSTPMDATLLALAKQLKHGDCILCNRLNQFWLIGILRGGGLAC